MDTKNENVNASFFYGEGALARAARSNKRMLVALIVSLLVSALAIGALLINNRMWMNYVQTIESQTAGRDGM